MSSEEQAPGGGAPKDEIPELRFDHNVIEHLGIKLYQNKPVNVLAELVANCWDADATHVWIDLRDVAGEQVVSVGDDGEGMSLATIKDRYLVIGKAKRARPKDKSTGGRLPMGRKGIGKLAPFGVARNVDIATVSAGVLNWFTLSLDGLRSSATVEGEHRYRPTFHVKDGAAELTGLVDGASPAGPEVRRFLRRMTRIPVDKRSGTLIVMYGLTANAALEPDTLAEGLGSRFSVVLLREDFRVRINRRLIGAAQALPVFDYRIPPEGFERAEVDGRLVRWWAGFIKKADWPADQAGVGVFAHHKIAQDRPFFFRAKGKEIYQRYLYGVVEADWLDELDRDLVSTDRTSIDWSDPETQGLLEWGRQQVGTWLESYTKWRETTLEGEIESTAVNMRRERRIPVFSAVENTAIVRLVTDVAADLGKGPQALQTREELLDVISRAWVNMPTRKLLKQAWRDLANASDDAEAFSKLVTLLSDRAVPEAMSLALTFAQRAFALGLLEDRLGKKSETKLQILVEEFPWIVQPRGSMLTANRTLKTTIDKLIDEDESPNRAGRTVRAMSHAERADFVFLTSAEETRVEVIEIKPNDPAHVLNMENRRQLQDYLDFIKTTRPNAKVTGVLIGWNGDYDPEDTRIAVKGWDQILGECRAAYLELLAGALAQADLDEADTRMEMVREFGGPRVWKWLKQVAADNEQLSMLMTRVQRRLNPPGEGAEPDSEGEAVIALPAPEGPAAAPEQS